MRPSLTLVILAAGCAAPARVPGPPPRTSPPDLASAAGLERAVLRATVDGDDAALGRVLAALRAWTPQDDVAALARAVELRCLALRISDDDAWAETARADLRALLERLPAAPSPEEAGATVVALLRLFEVTADPALLDGALVRGETLARAAHDPDGAAPRAAALLALFEATGTPRWLTLALVAAGRLPDGSAAAARVLLRLEAATRDAVWAAAGRARLRGAAPGPERDLAHDELALHPLTIAVTGPPGDPMVDALLRAARRCYPPRAVVVRLAPGDGYPDLGRAAVFLDGGGGWTSAPIEDPAAVRLAVESWR